MVTATARFRVVAPAGTRINVDDPGAATGGVGALTLPNILGLLFPGYNPIQFPTPGTGGGTGSTQDDVVNPNPNGTCPSGYTLTGGLCVQNQQTSCPAGQLLIGGNCIPITSLPQCPTGYARNLTTGVCDLVNPGGGGTTPLPNPPPVAGAVSIITEVLVPARVVPNQSFTITLKFKNLSTIAEKFASRIQIAATGLALDTFSSLFEVAAGANGVIQTTITLPNATPVATYPASITLYRRIITGQVVFEDLDNFSLFVDQSTPFPGDVPPPTNTAVLVAVPTTYVKETTPVLQVNGAGFQHAEVITVKWVEKLLTLKQTNITASATGTLSDTVTLNATNNANNVIVTATGTVSSATVTIVATEPGTVPPPTTGTCPPTPISLNIKVLGTRKYEVRFSNSGFKSGETVDIKFFNGLTGVQFASTTDDIAGSDDKGTVTVPSGITCCKMTVTGRKSGKTITGYFPVPPL